MRDDNPVSFASEMMNEPTDSRTSIIPREIVYCWNKDYASKEALLKFIGNKASFTLSCDPSMGKATTRGDHSALILFVKDNNIKVCYVIEADIKRRPIDELIQDILSYASRYRLTSFVIETNGFQELVLRQLREEAKKQNIYLPEKEVKTSSDKIGRIQGMYKYIKSKELQFDKSHTFLLEQLCMFPNHKYDDGPDALQFGFEATLCSGKVQVRIFERKDDWRGDYRRNLGWNL